MPIPKPSGGEKEDAFVGRCMENATMKSEYSDNKQRLAVCYSSWRKAKGIKEKQAKQRIGRKRSLKEVVAYANRATGKYWRPFTFGSMIISEVFRSLREALAAAVRTRFGKDSYVQDFSNKEAVVGFYKEGGMEVSAEGKEKYQKIGYKISKGEVVFTTSAVVVQLVKAYESENLTIADFAELNQFQQALKEGK